MSIPLRISLLVLPVLIILLTASCGGILSSDKPADRTFWLQPYIPPQNAATPADAPGLTVSFDVVPGLDSDHLLTMNPDAEMNHYSGANWPDHLPEFVGSLLRRSLQSSGLFSRINADREAGVGDCTLDLELQRFYTNINHASAASSVQIAMSGHFECHDTARSVQLAAAVGVGGQQITSIVTAHQQAFNDLMHSLINQLQ